RIAREVVAALGASYALDQTRPAKPQQDLLDVIGRQALGVGQLARGDGLGRAATAAGEMQRDDEAVFGPGGDPHASISQDHPPAGIPFPPGTPISVIARRSSTSSSFAPSRIPFRMTSSLTVRPVASASFASLAASAYPI